MAHHFVDMRARSITVQLIGVDGEPFKEYKDPIDFQDTENLTHTLIELPPPDAYQEFSMKYSSDEKAYFTYTGGLKNVLSFYHCFGESEPGDAGPFYGKFLHGVEEPVRRDVCPIAYNPETNESVICKPCFTAMEIGL